MFGPSPGCAALTSASSHEAAIPALLPAPLRATLAQDAHAAAAEAALLPPKRPPLPGGPAPPPRDAAGGSSPGDSLAARGLSAAAVSTLHSLLFPFFFPLSCFIFSFFHAFMLQG